MLASRHLSQRDVIKLWLTVELSKKSRLGKKVVVWHMRRRRNNLSHGVRWGNRQRSRQASYGRVLYNYYRTYDPKTGRYYESDPIGLEGGLNSYFYVGGNPITWADRTGQFYIPFTDIWIPAGEQYGARAAQYWADKQAQTGNWLYAIPGALASLWTPCTSNKTALTLSSGAALGALTKGASLSRFFWDPRKFKSISRQYWGAEGANGMSLDHWLVSQAAARAGTVPAGIANAGFNLLEMPATWNTWLGFARNWGGMSALLAKLARLGIQTGVPTAAGTAGAAGYAIGSDANRCGCQ